MGEALLRTSYAAPPRTDSESERQRPARDKPAPYSMQKAKAKGAAGINARPTARRKPRLILATGALIGLGDARVTDFAAPEIEAASQSFILFQRPLDAEVR